MNIFTLEKLLKKHNKNQNLRLKIQKKKKQNRNELKFGSRIRSISVLRHKSRWYRIVTGDSIDRNENLNDFPTGDEQTQVAFSGS